MSSLNPIGIPFIELPAVDSTNNYAMGLVRAGMAQHGTAVFAHEQTEGKGQRNKQWVSQKDQNIAISVVLEPTGLDSSKLFLLSMAMAVGTLEFFNTQIAGEIKIKWPNDIYWRDRKAAGILIENVWQQNEWKFAVVGIGINVNQTHFGELEHRAVSLKQVTGKDHDPVLLAKDLCRELDKQFDKLVRMPSEIINDYNQNLYKLNETVKLKKDARIFKAIIKDVDTNGQLVVQHATEEKFDVGEVEWII